MLLKYNRNLYSKDALLKAAFNFTDKAYIHLSQTENEYIVDFVVKREISCQKKNLTTK